MRYISLHWLCIITLILIHKIINAELSMLGEESWVTLGAAWNGDRAAFYSIWHPSMPPLTRSLQRALQFPVSTTHRTAMNTYSTTRTQEHQNTRTPLALIPHPSWASPTYPHVHISQFRCPSRRKTCSTPVFHAQDRKKYR